jgi:DNA-binding winged helix-turn-helix (wHTH) protein
VKLPEVREGRVSQQKLLELKWNLSGVKLEIQDSDLFLILTLLAEHQQRGLVRNFLTQLWVEEFVTKETAYKLAEHFAIKDFSLD